MLGNLPGNSKCKVIKLRQVSLTFWNQFLTSRYTLTGFQSSRLRKWKGNWPLLMFMKKIFCDHHLIRNHVLSIKQWSQTSTVKRLSVSNYHLRSRQRRQYESFELIEISNKSYLKRKDKWPCGLGNTVILGE